MTRYAAAIFLAVLALVTSGVGAVSAVPATPTIQAGRCSWC